MNYASDFTKANDAVKKFSKRYHYPFIDNNRAFKHFIKKYPRNSLFADDNHFHPLGYELMAKNLFSFLKEHDLIKP